MKTILYIEDEALQREIMERLYPQVQRSFKGQVKFITCDSWESGMELVKSGHIDIIVVDLTLPPWHKEETLFAIRQNASRLPPVIVLTGNEIDDDLRRQSILAGADDFLLKSEVMRHPEQLCERVYIAYVRRNRESIQNGAEL